MLRKATGRIQSDDWNIKVVKKDMANKISEHPTTKLIKKIEEQEKKIQALEIDVTVLRDLLLRTVRMLAKMEMEGTLKKTPALLK
jgi:hypothetical protein